jgi:hypothetical protein|tara:strand:- start:673 stop:846 length:174 start_codon:yes stop_codon:yes gene_type:complete
MEIKTIVAHREELWNPEYPAEKYLIKFLKEIIKEKDQEFEKLLQRFNALQIEKESNG